MRTILATFAGLVALAAVSAQAAPVPPAKATGAELGASPAIELVRQGCGWVGTVVIGGTVGGIGIGVAAIRIGDFGPTGRPCTWCGPHQAV